MAIGTRKKTLGSEHVSTGLTNVIIKIGADEYLASLQIRPSTCTIYNVSTTTANWTAIASGLTNVLSWKLKEKDGDEFDYCFDGVGTTYMTSLGESLQRETDIAAVYVKRRGSTNINMQLEVWSA